MLGLEWHTGEKIRAFDGDGWGGGMYLLINQIDICIILFAHLYQLSIVPVDSIEH